MKQWLCGPLQPMMRDLLEGPGIRERGWFQTREVARLVREHVAGRENHAHRLWCLMSLELSLAALTARASARTALSRKVAP
jgi:asparagine synthase (glutamine-hydrolysing)